MHPVRSVFIFFMIEPSYHFASGSTADAASDGDQPPERPPANKSVEIEAEAPAAGDGDRHGGLNVDELCPPQSRALFATVEAPALGTAALTDEANKRTAGEVSMKDSETDKEKEELRWWLEIVGAGKVVAS